MTLCLLGFHRWQQSRPLTPHDAFPFHGFPYENPTRKCVKCRRTQRWLPGYGGSEFGCWMPVQREGQGEGEK